MDFFSLPVVVIVVIVEELVHGNIINNWFVPNLLDLKLGFSHSITKISNNIIK